jgi:tripartite-type tricarboxylate transporter receptor subunit TctC
MKLIRLIITLFSLLSLPAIADEPYPNKPISLIAANPPGGASDINARILVEPWSSVLKQPVVVVNRPGAGGAIGAAQVATSKPDGYTLLLALSSVIVSPEAEIVSGRKPLYELNQLEPIALLSSDPMIIVVRADSPYKTLDDLLKAAKEKPNTITYSSSGNFGPIHLSVEMLAFQAGVKFAQIPFGGGGPSMIALLGGQVDFTTAAPSVAAQQIAAGKIRPLAVSSAKRLAAFPDIPTYKDLGFNTEYYIWAGLYAPSATPPAVVKTLRDSIQKAIANPQYIEAMKKAGILIDYRDAPEFKKFAYEDGQRMLKVIRAIGKID